MKCNGDQPCVDLTLDVRKATSFSYECVTVGATACQGWKMLPLTHDLDVCDTSNVAAHIGLENVDEMDNFDGIGAMNEEALDTVTVTGKDLLFFMSLMVNAFALMIIAYGCTKRCKKKQKKVIYQPVSIVSENEILEN